MAGKAIWKGYIHFSGVDVPVKLHTAIKEERIQFHLLHKKDHVRLRQQMVCAYEKVPVPAEEQTRGFELEAGKYILIDPAGLEETEPEESRIIEIHEFVKAGSIEPVFLDRVYYLEPDSPIRGYAVLLEALREMDVQGICSWTMRKRSYTGALEVSGKALRLSTLRYADEVVHVKSLELPDVSLSEKEVKIGSDLIQQMAGPFDPRKFENEHQKKLQDLIDKKARGEKIVILAPRHLEPTRPDKLLETLKASLKKVA